ncbi:MAG: hypothetical protein H6658_20865 [Ardenticatenaceae bacterium]|nr:hypothetical protein [Ardenticatenaceae bacterium]
MRHILLRPAAWQTGFLTGVDGLTNLIDYGFHIYLARVLLPGDFAIIQTINTAVLILLTAFAVLQPVVARYTAEALELPDTADNILAIFQFYGRRSALVGLALWLIAWLLRQPIAVWLKVPPTAVSLTTFVLFLATTRPVIAGLLQGRHQFMAFGGTRLANALARLACAIVLVTLLRLGLMGAVVALPVGGLVALLFGLVAAGRHMWQSAPTLPPQFHHSTQLIVSAFVAFMAYMSLLNVDLIWVNRLFAPEIAGSYATAVLLRRVLSLLPAAVIVVMYPRVVAKVAQGQLPDKLLLQTAVVTMLPILLFTIVYATLGNIIIRWTFGAAYSSADSLLLGMGIAMLGFSLTAVWLNFYLATRPLPFVGWLTIMAVTQILLFNQFHGSAANFVLIFAASGWLTAIGGLLLYLLWLRPLLKSASSSPDATRGLH